MFKVLKDRKVFFKYLNTNVNDDFSLMVVGCEKMTPDDPPKGPMCKSNYVLHYCVKGKGTYYTKGKYHEVGEGDFFVCYPNEVIKWFQDRDDPWEYVWFEFCGAAAKGLMTRAKFSADDPVWHSGDRERYNLAATFIDNMNDLSDDLFCTAAFYSLLSDVIAARASDAACAKTRHNSLFRDVIDYLDNNFSNPDITLGSVSEYFHINKNYLARLFKAETDTTLTKYVLTLRINKACDLLKNGNLSVKTVSYSVGFTDSLYFSKKYKEVMGFPPSAFKPEHFA